MRLCGKILSVMGVALYRDLLYTVIVVFADGCSVVLHRYTMRLPDGVWDVVCPAGG